MIDTIKYKEWLDMAKRDIKAAKILYEYEGDKGIICFHCQQAVEKYLKGYLIYKTGMLNEGHSLTKLCKKASQFDDRFKSIIKDCAFLNQFYIETRYPAEDPLIVEEEDVEESMQIAERIIKLIDSIIEEKS
ncbi:MAG: HEPN domain-containing protein [Thermovenabulum sp.]|uniref:HEPN domain-containing protein n=1 Tax=Thermovenabulum sp. TaxID=3100335 RepID=UPI003C7B3535